MRDAKGNFYGTTLGGGVQSQGTVFELTPAGSENAFFSFSGADGALPETTLIQAAGNFYGTTFEGGDSSGCPPLGCGVVFEVSPNGTETVLHMFTNGTDGANPVGSLVQDAQGNLYGTASSGGKVSRACPTGCGTVYKLSPGKSGSWRSEEHTSE